MEADAGVTAMALDQAGGESGLVLAGSNTGVVSAWDSRSQHDAWQVSDAHGNSKCSIVGAVG